MRQLFGYISVGCALWAFICVSGVEAAGDLPYCAIDEQLSVYDTGVEGSIYAGRYKAALNDELFDLADFVDETLAKQGVATSDSIELLVTELDGFAQNTAALHSEYVRDFAENNSEADIFAQLAFDQLADRELVAVRERAEYAFSLAVFADIEIERNRLLVESVEDMRSEYERYVQYLLVTLQAMKGVNNYLPCVCDSCQ